MASSRGMVMKIPYTVPMPRGGFRTYGGTAHPGVWAKKCRRYIIIIKGKTYKIASLVCEAFHGARPAKMVCMHLDENSRNNAASNLSWGTQKENLNAPGFKAYCRGRTGKNNPYIKGKLTRMLDEQRAATSKPLCI